MPYKFDTEKKLIPKTLWRSNKISEYERSNIIKLHGEGRSIHSLSKQFGVSRRLIQFIVFPERRESNEKLRKERGGSSLYYNKEDHNISVRKCRNYRKELDRDGLLKDNKEVLK